MHQASASTAAAPTPPATAQPAEASNPAPATVSASEAPEPLVFAARTHPVPMILSALPTLIVHLEACALLTLAVV